MTEDNNIEIENKYREGKDSITYCSVRKKGTKKKHRSNKDLITIVT